MTKRRDSTPLMRALRFDGSTVSVRRVEIPEPSPGEALIEVIRAGVCSTDLEITRGYMGFRGTLGHEFVGSIVALNDRGSGSRDAHAAARRGIVTGCRVVGEINLPCRNCPSCRRGDGNHCPKRTVLGILDKDGAFADFLTLPLANLHAVPKSVNDETATFAEPLAAALRVPEQVSISDSTRVLVIGDGKLGLLVAMVLSRASRRVTLVGKHPGKMAMTGLAGLRCVPLTRAHSLRRTYDVVVEASGRPDGWSLAVSKVRPRGTVVLKSTTHHDRPWNPAPLVIDEITVVGSRCGPFEKALAWLEKGWIDPRPMVTKTLRLEEGDRALTEAARPGTLKVHLTP